MVLVSFGAVVSIVDKVESSENFDYVSGELIVCFEDPVGLKVGNRDPVLGFEITETISSINCAVVKVPKNKEDYYIKIYERDDKVVYAEKNGIMQKVEFPNDEHWEKQYGPRNIKCPEAWDFMSWNLDPIIAIVDTGIEYKNGNIHEDLAPNYYMGYDCVDEDSQPWDSDDHRHGTHCAGIAAAATHNNGIGIAGVTGANSPQIMAVRVLGAGGGTFADVAQGIIYASDNVAHVISMSLGCYYDSPTVEAACKTAWEAGSVLVAASGNDNQNAKDHFPSAYDCVIAVAAIDSNNKKASFSNYGTSVELCAPGERIYSCSQNNGYRYLSGTSMACPHVSGVAALAFARNDINDDNGNGRINDEVRDKLFETADAIEGTGNYWRYGRVDATLGGAPPVETPSITVTIDSVTNQGEGLDDLDIPGAEPPEWSYETRVIGLEGTQKVKNFRFKEISYNDNNAATTEGEDLYAKFWSEEIDEEVSESGSKAWYFGDSYIFPVNEKNVKIEIKVMDEDWTEYTRDIADICSRSNADEDSIISDQLENGRVFVMEYDFTKHKIIDENSDRYETDNNGLKYTRGNWDGSNDGENWPITDYKQDDALLKFQISDDYVSPDPSFELSGKQITGHSIKFVGESEQGFDPLTYEWDFGNGDTGSGQSINYDYGAEGSYTVRLTVTDRFGVSDTFEDTITITKNSAPNKPSKPSGTKDGKVGNSYSYTTSTSEDDGDQVWYKWSWGDGEQSEWIGPYSPGETCSASHSWDERSRDLEVKVKARDAYGGVSSWSDPLSVIMPKTKSVTNPLIFDFISHFPFLKLFFPFLEPLLLK